jgi:hypothetical protein
VPSPKLVALELTDDERRVLESWARRRKTGQALAVRSRIVLACADGASNHAVAAQMGVSRVTAAKWRSRFLKRRLEGLTDKPRPDRKMGDIAITKLGNRQKRSENFNRPQDIPGFQCKGGEGCVIVERVAGAVVIRDSQNPTHPGLVFSAREYAEFRRRVLQGSRLDRARRTVFAILRLVIAMALRGLRQPGRAAVSGGRRAAR